jgi:hypothetical protein
MHHAHFYLNITLIKNASERSLDGTFEQSSALSHVAEHWTEITVTLYLKGLTKLLRMIMASGGCVRMRLKPA